MDGSDFGSANGIAKQRIIAVILTITIIQIVITRQRQFNGVIYVVGVQKLHQHVKQVFDHLVRFGLLTNLKKTPNIHAYKPLTISLKNV